MEVSGQHSCVSAAIVEVSEEEMTLTGVVVIDELVVVAGTVKETLPFVEK